MDPITTLLSSLLVLFLGGDSVIKGDEEVIFFPTFGHLDKDRATWVLPIHGWIYEPERNSAVRREALELFRRSLGLGEDEAKAARFKDRARAFLVDNERGKRVAVRLGHKTFSLDPSGPDGHFKGVVRLPLEEVRRLPRDQKDPDGWLPFRAITRVGDGREFAGRVQAIGEKGLSVISDVDDTVKVSEVADPAALLANTFLREYRPVPGMAALFQSWARSGAVFHYVSASPWQLYRPLAEFARANDFPRGTFHLMDFRWKDARFLNLFASPEEVKRKTIVPILETFPRRRFLLVGDCGEKDPELYGDLARTYEQVARVLIRDWTGQGLEAARYRRAFRGLAKEKWRVFRDPAELDDLKGKHLD